MHFKVLLLCFLFLSFGSTADCELDLYDISQEISLDNGQSTDINCPLNKFPVINNNYAMINVEVSCIRGQVLFNGIQAFNIECLKVSDWDFFTGIDDNISLNDKFSSRLFMFRPGLEETKLNFTCGSDKDINYMFSAVANFNLKDLTSQTCQTKCTESLTSSCTVDVYLNIVSLPVYLTEITYKCKSGFYVVEMKDEDNNSNLVAINPLEVNNCQAISEANHCLLNNVSVLLIKTSIDNAYALKENRSIFLPCKESSVQGVAISVKLSCVNNEIKYDNLENCGDCVMVPGMFSDSMIYKLRGGSPVMESYAYRKLNENDQVTLVCTNGKGIKVLSEDLKAKILMGCKDKKFYYGPKDTSKIYNSPLTCEQADCSSLLLQNLLGNNVSVENTVLYKENQVISVKCKSGSAISATCSNKKFTFSDSIFKCLRLENKKCILLEEFTDPKIERVGKKNGSLQEVIDNEQSVIFRCPEYFVFEVQDKMYLRAIGVCETNTVTFFEGKVDQKALKCTQVANICKMKELFQKASNADFLVTETDVIKDTITERFRVFLDKNEVKIKCLYYPEEYIATCEKNEWKVKDADGKEFGSICIKSNKLSSMRIVAIVFGVAALVSFITIATLLVMFMMNEE